MASEVCDLPDGRRIRFSLLRRDDRPCYFACFRGPDRKRREVSTLERNRKRAQDAALAAIRQAFAPPSETDSLAWDDAVQLAVRYMTADNLRGTTIQQYEVAIRNLRKVFPNSKGPGDVTPAMAEQYKLKRLEGKRAPRTVENDIGNLSIVFAKWFKGKLRIVESNPFADVDPPRYDKPTPRYIATGEQQVFFRWMMEHWAWRLPVLFLETQAAIGCRIGELSSALTINLRDGRLYFPADTTKGREERACLLPTALYAELQAVAGPTYVFERFSAQLREVYRAQGNRYAANAVQDFTPARIKRWLQDKAKYYFRRTGATRFKLHNFRGTAMSKARLAGGPEDDAAVAFDCAPQTMRQHYLAFDKTTVADRVFQRLSGAVSGAVSENKSAGACRAQKSPDEKGLTAKSP